MAALIDLTMAATHLDIDETEFADALQPKIDQATAIVIHYIKRPAHGWTLSTDPNADPEFAIVQAAILKVVGNLWRYRGDDEVKTEGPMTQDVVALLSMVRDPTLS